MPVSKFNFEKPNVRPTDLEKFAARNTTVRAEILKVKDFGTGVNTPPATTLVKPKPSNQQVVPLKKPKVKQQPKPTVVEQPTEVKQPTTEKPVDYSGMTIRQGWPTAVKRMKAEDADNYVVGSLAKDDYDFKYKPITYAQAKKLPKEVQKKYGFDINSK